MGQWTSNLSWISPFDEEANTDYLMALSSAGFDFILSSIGTHFGLKGLACYHITFIALTVSKRGHLHYDLTGTDSRNDASRGFNIIIPLLLADETGPELDVQSEDDEVGRLKYQYDVAVLVSWWAELLWGSHENLQISLEYDLNVRWAMMHSTLRLQPTTGELNR